jgi:hypothetical protein
LIAQQNQVSGSIAAFIQGPETWRLHGGISHFHFHRENVTAFDINNLYEYMEM